MKMATRVCVALLLGFAAAGCAYRPVVDPKHTDMAKYETDLVECRQVAEQGPGTGGRRGRRGEEQAPDRQELHDPARPRRAGLKRSTRPEAGDGHGARSPT